MVKKQLSKRLFESKVSKVQKNIIRDFCPGCAEALLWDRMNQSLKIREPPPTGPFGSLLIGNPANFSQNQGNFLRIQQKFCNLRNTRIFQDNLMKFRKNFIKIGTKTNQNCRKIVIFGKISAKNQKGLTKISNLTEILRLERCKGMSIL